MYSEEEKKANALEIYFDEEAYLRWTFPEWLEDRYESSIESIGD